MTVANETAAPAAEGSKATDRYTIISADCHAGGTMEMYREHLDPAWLEEFDAWRGAYKNPFRDLQGGVRKLTPKHLFSSALVTESSCAPVALCRQRRAVPPTSAMSRSVSRVKPCLSMYGYPCA